MAPPRLAKFLALPLVPDRFLAAQLRRPSGRFGRWVMTRGLNDGNAALIAAAVDALQLTGSQAFLDVGFGGGRSLLEAARRTRGPLWGVDFSADMVREGHRRLGSVVGGGRLNLLTADVAELPLRDAWVDAICSTNTIYFWPDLPAALGELGRVLRPGGRLALGFTGREKMRRFDRVTRHGFTTFMPEDLEPALSAAGFADVHTLRLHGDAVEGDFVTLAERPA